MVGPTFMPYITGDSMVGPAFFTITESGMRHHYWLQYAFCQYWLWGDSHHCWVWNAFHHFYLPFGRFYHYWDWYAFVITAVGTFFTAGTDSGTLSSLLTLVRFSRRLLPFERFHQYWPWYAFHHYWPWYAFRGRCWLEYAFHHYWVWYWEPHLT